MSDRICPWWLGYFLASPVRRLFQDPRRILAPYLRQGMVVLEPGPGMGFFTLEMARMVGPTGRIVAVDVQEKMLAVLRRKAGRAGLASRIDIRLVEGDSLGIADLRGRFDFVLAFAVVHELPNAAAFLSEAAAALKPGGHLLIAEPTGHVSAQRMGDYETWAGKVGFSPVEGVRIRRSRVLMLRKS